MAIVKSFEGVGSLVMRTGRYDRLPYRLDVRRISSQRLQATGSLTFTAPSSSMAAFHDGDGKGTLQLKTGENVTVLLTKMDPCGQPVVDFVAAGSLPGIE
jgi:hypothetical protein